MFTSYDKRQQAAERAALFATRQLAAHAETGHIEPTTNWDAEFARFYGTTPPTIQAPEV